MMIFLFLAPYGSNAKSANTIWVHCRACSTIKAMLKTVPPPDEIKAMLEQIGAPTDYIMLGLDCETVVEALDYGHYLCGHFTIMKLLKLIGTPLVC